MQKIHVTYRKVSELIPYARNARTHSDEQVAEIAASIKEFGWSDPIVLDGENGILAGHGRLLAARKLGLSEVPTIDLHGLTPAQKKAFVIANNKLAEKAGWDEELLGLEMADLKALDYDLSLTGFDMGEIDALIADVQDHPQEDPDEDLPEAPEQPVTKTGDVWVLGVHRLMCADSTKPENLRILMGEKEDIMGGGHLLANLYLTDPPYNVSYTGKTKDALSIQNDSMSDPDFREFLIKAFSAANSVLSAGAPFYIWHADSEGFNFRGACHDIGWEVRECLIWSKNSMVLGRQDYNWKHEPCLYGWKEGAAHPWYSDRKQTTVIEARRPTRNGEHPTMKPVELFRYLIENSSKAGDIVLDSFAGSGTTVVACEETGRCARAMELDPVYCDVIIERWQKMTGLKAVRESDGALFDDLKGELQ